MTNFFKNLQGILISPGPTLGKVMEKKQWVASLILILSVVFIFTFISTPELVEKSRISDYLPEQIESIGSISGFRLIMVSLWSVIITLITLTIAAFFTYLFYGIARAEGTYANYFTIVVNASFIGTVIPMILGLISISSGISIINLFNPASLISVPRNSLGFFILSKFGLFYIWYLIAIAAGVSFFSKLSLKKCLLVAFLYFLFTSTIKISFSYLAFKLMGM